MTRIFSILIILTFISCGEESTDGYATEKDYAVRYVSDSTPGFQEARSLKNKLALLYYNFDLLKQTEVDTQICESNERLFNSINDTLTIYTMVPGYLSDFDTTSPGYFKIPGQEPREGGIMTHFFWLMGDSTDAVQWNLEIYGSLNLDNIPLKNVDLDVNPFGIKWNASAGSLLLKLRETHEAFTQHNLILFALTRAETPAFLGPKEFQKGVLSGYLIPVDFENAEPKCVIPIESYSTDSIEVDLLGEKFNEEIVIEANKVVMADLKSNFMQAIEVKLKSYVGDKVTVIINP